MGLLILEDENREYFAIGIPALYEEFKTLYPKKRANAEIRNSDTKEQSVQ